MIYLPRAWTQTGLARTWTPPVGAEYAPSSCARGRRTWAPNLVSRHRTGCFPRSGNLASSGAESGFLPAAGRVFPAAGKPGRLTRGRAPSSCGRPTGLLTVVAKLGFLARGRRPVLRAWTPPVGAELGFLARRIGLPAGAELGFLVRARAPNWVIPAVRTPGRLAVFPGDRRTGLPAVAEPCFLARAEPAVSSDARTSSLKIVVNRVESASVVTSTTAP